MIGVFAYTAIGDGACHAYASIGIGHELLALLTLALHAVVVEHAVLAIENYTDVAVLALWRVCLITQFAGCAVRVWGSALITVRDIARHALIFGQSCIGRTLACWCASCLYDLRWLA